MNKLETFFSIPLSEIYSDQSFNCRSEITNDSILDLAQSIENFGLQTPICIQQKEHLPQGCKYRIIAGHRRYAACLYLGHETIDAKVVENLNEQQAKILNLSENIDRKNLTPYEEATALASIFPETVPLRKMSKLLNRSLEWCRRRRELLQYPEEIQLGFHKGFLGIRDLVALASLDKSVKDDVARRLMCARMAGKDIPMGTVTTRTLHKTTTEIQKLRSYFLSKKITGLPVKILSWVLGTVDEAEVKRATRTAERDSKRALYDT